MTTAFHLFMALFFYGLSACSLLAALLHRRAGDDTRAIVFGSFTAITTACAIVALVQVLP